MRDCAVPEIGEDDTESESNKEEQRRAGRASISAAAAGLIAAIRLPRWAGGRDAGCDGTHFGSRFDRFHTCESLWCS